MLRRSHADLCLCLVSLFGLSAIALTAPAIHRASAPAAAVQSDSAPENDTAAGVVAPEPIPPVPPRKAKVQTGVASWYGIHWQGRRTASGERFDTRLLTAAHRSLPLNTMVRVTNLLNGRSVEVTVNDRGPYVGHRVIDLSEAAAKRLDMVKKGLVPVRIEILPPPQQMAMLMNPS